VDFAGKLKDPMLNAGLFFAADKSVKGKLTTTISPLTNLSMPLQCPFLPLIRQCLKSDRWFLRKSNNISLKGFGGHLILSVDF